MKYLLVALVVIIAIGIWRNNRRKAAAPAPAKKPRLAEPENMVTCAHCGLHLPASDALEGSNQLHYCSREHQQINSAKD